MPASASPRAQSAGWARAKAHYQPTGSKDKHSNSPKQVTGKDSSGTNKRTAATPNTHVYNNSQTRYNLRQRHPLTGQISANVKRESKDCLSSTSSGEHTVCEISDSKSCKTNKGEYLPDFHQSNIGNVA